MIITCPNCQTRYQVAQNAIGSAGRKVQCANCQKSWQAVPEPETPPPPKPRLVEKAPVEEVADSPELDAAKEDALDADFEAEEQAVSEPKAKPQKSDPQAREEDSLDKGLNEKRNKDMRTRQINFAKKLPMGRIRHNLRIAVIAALVIFIVCGFFLRTEIVRYFPDFAGIYQAIGLPVNVIGLEFDNVETLRAQRDGQDVTLISGMIRNVVGRQVRVPAVVVSILNADGATVYSWSVTAPVQLIGPGESVEFETQLNAAPQDAQTIKLLFADGRAR